MRRKIGTAVVAVILFAGSSIVCLGQTGGSPSADEKGVGGDPKAEGIGSTGSTHNPTGSAPNTTGMENRTGTEVGTDTSTHNPTGKKD